jgi:hypothetical protein
MTFARSTSRRSLPNYEIGVNLCKVPPNNRMQRSWSA